MLSRPWRGGSRADRPEAPEPAEVKWFEVTDGESPAGPTGRHKHVRLRVHGVSAFLALVAGYSGSATTSRLTLEVTPWETARYAPAPQLGWVDGLTHRGVTVGEGRIRLSLRADDPMAVGTLLVAAVPAVAGVRPSTTTGRPDRAVLRPAVELTSFVSTADRIVERVDLDDDKVRPVDLLLAATPSPGPSDAVAEVVVADPELLACVDPAVHRPVDRVLAPAVLDATFVAPGRLAIEQGDGEPLRVGGRQGLSDLDVRALRAVGRVVLSAAPQHSVDVRLLRQLSAVGVVVSAPSTDQDPLARLWAQPVGDDELELASVAQSRTAHRHHSIARIGSAGVVPESAAPAMSVLLSTNRPDRLANALATVAELDYPRLQLVLGLHGIPAQVVEDVLAPALAELDGRVDVVVHEAAADVPFGQVLAALSTRADGDLQTKVDDDDHYGPGHLWDLVVAHEYSGAAVVGKVAEYVYLVDEDVTVRRRLAVAERYGHAVAGGAMCVSRADLAALGGWRPLSRAVDRALLDRALRAGAGVYRTNAFGFVYTRGHDSHTWAAPEGFASDVRDRWDGLVIPGAL